MRRSGRRSRSGSHRELRGSVSKTLRRVQTVSDESPPAGTYRVKDRIRPPCATTPFGNLQWLSRFVPAADVGRTAAVAQKNGHGDQPRGSVFSRLSARQTPENGCLALSFLATISAALGSFFIARAIDSFVAS